LPTWSMVRPPVVENRVDDPATQVAVIIAREDDPARIVAGVTAVLESQRDADYAKGSAIFVPGAPNTMGVRVPVLKAMGRPLSKFAKAEPKLGMEIARLLWGSNTREHKLLAAMVLEALTAKSPELAQELLFEWLTDLTDWEIVDSLASCLEKVLCRNPKKALGWGREWLTSEQTWVRRLGMVITVPMSRDKEMDLVALANHLEHARGETHPTQLKALGWCWREIGRREPELVFKRLQAWATSGHRQDRRVAWSGSEKCTPQQRQVIRNLIDGTEKKTK
jgi:3-methyladenine DNA glycosylase AlkD